MKVISGVYKGRNIEGFDIDGTRPTMDRVKESLFAMIQNDILESTVLDLFSGSGNLGIEALSNGAKIAYLVDKNYKACRIIKNNVVNMGITNDVILNMDYKKALDYFNSENIKFNIIFLDPPYKTDYIEKSIDLILKYGVLEHDGLIIAESDSLDKIVYSDTLRVLREKKYGDKWVVILKYL